MHPKSWISVIILKNKTVRFENIRNEDFKLSVSLSVLFVFGCKSESSKENKILKNNALAFLNLQVEH